MPPTSRAQLALLAVLVTILIGWVLHAAAGILQPLAIALLLASILQPVVRGLARWHIPPFVTVITIIVMLFVGLVQLAILLQYNLQSLIDGPVPGPTLIVEEEGLDGPLTTTNQVGWEGVISRISDRMQDSSLPPEVVNYLTESMREIQPETLATGLLGSGFGFLKSLTLVLIYMLFIFAEQAVFRRKILAIAGERGAEARRILDTIGRGIQRYLGVKTIVSFATGALCYAAMVYLRIPYAPLFGFLTFLLNYIPTFGSIIAGSLPTAVAFAVEPSPTKAILVMIIFLSVNLTLGSFVEPKILGRELNLSPLVVIISVVVWAGLWGVVGTFLAVPLTAAMQIVLASNAFTRPVAVLLSSGPPREQRPLQRLLNKSRPKPRDAEAG